MDRRSRTTGTSRSVDRRRGPLGAPPARRRRTSRPRGDRLACRRLWLQRGFGRRRRKATRPRSGSRGWHSPRVSRERASLAWATSDERCLGSAAATIGPRSQRLSRRAPAAQLTGAPRPRALTEPADVARRPHGFGALPAAAHVGGRVSSQPGTGSFPGGGRRRAIASRRRLQIWQRPVARRAALATLALLELVSTETVVSAVIPNQLLTKGPRKRALGAVRGAYTALSG